jgi:P4 family phage/plasmid primase-like protien
MEPLKYYTRKNTVLQKCEQENKILANRQMKKYFVIDSYPVLLELIKRSDVRDFYEYIPRDKCVCFFFDIDMKKDMSTYFDDFEPLVSACSTSVRALLEQNGYKNVDIKQIILESHSEEKRSFHIILRISSNKKRLMFKNVEVVRSLYKQVKLDTYKDIKNKPLIDSSVYREGLFRTYLSTKCGENRPLVKSYLSDDFEDIETFVCYEQNEFDIFQKAEVVNVPEDLSESDIYTIKKFVQKEFHHLQEKIRDVFIDKQYNCIIVALTERYCPFLDSEHKSNNQYVIIDTTSAKQKCHDTDCNEEKYSEIKLENYPKEINEIIKKCLKVSQQELELIDTAIIECKNYISENYDQDVIDVSFDRTAMIFRGIVADRSLAKIIKGKCPECNVEHQISDGGYVLKCKTCQAIFPKNQIIPVDQKYKHLNNFWTAYQINAGTINNIINIYNTTGEQDFSCDVQLDASIIKDKKIRKIINECLDGHKITKLAELMYNIYKDYIFTGIEWFIFEGNKWSVDNRSINFKRNILDLCNTFNKIKQFYEGKNVDEKSVTLIKNIKSLIIKINKPQLKDEILKDAQLFYNDNAFYSKLNNKNHLVPFTNGVYDLLVNKFRKTKKDDYVNLVVGYNYSESVDNPEVNEFIRKILPNEGVRNYVMKKMSECLNGDIPNTHFLMFIGDGANGKSQLLNLMKLAMGELGEKVEVTLLTRKRNNANEANTEKVKLMNKRFAFLSEPEDGEKINIGLLKELTGSEEIVARGLYQDSVSFVMEAKLYLACNELPEIKGEDTALWRRIRVIDFPSRFVDDPKEENEYKIDRTLPSRMREDITWRQTFLKILLEFYYKEVTEPNEVKVRTNEYRQDNNELFAWLDENVEYKENSILELKNVCDLVGLHMKIKISNKQKNKIKLEVQKWIKEKYPRINHEHQYTHFNNTKYRGWLHFGFKNDNDIDD